MLGKHPLYGIRRPNYPSPSATTKAWRELNNSLTLVLLVNVLLIAGASTVCLRGIDSALDSLGQALSLMH